MIAYLQGKSFFRSAFCREDLGSKCEGAGPINDPALRGSVLRKVLDSDGSGDGDRDLGIVAPLN